MKNNKLQIVYLESLQDLSSVAASDVSFLLFALSAMLRQPPSDWLNLPFS